jgi:uncharacterized protein YjbJ (UPF0337 family)
MDESTKNKIEGAVHDIKGSVKEKVGQTINDPDLESEGTGEKLAGKVQKKIGEIQEVLEK